MQQGFFEKYNIDPLQFDRSGLRWNDLESISDHYSSVRKDLEATARYTVDNILTCSLVHSINYRIKDNEHLLEKIIRKSVADPGRSIHLENYQQEISDLIGVRVLHLFKEDWSGVHDFISKSWEFAEQPVAYVRKGDSRRIVDFYQENNCRIEEHPHGYRSVHYLIQSGSGKRCFTVELQVRTLFEEAWGEIDHVVRYPYHRNNELLVRLSSILNRLSGDADELGTYMRYLNHQMQVTEELHRKEIENKNRLIDSLKESIENLKIDSAEKHTLTKTLDALEAEQANAVQEEGNFMWLNSFLETDLFKSLSSRITEIVSSADFSPIEVSEEDVEILGNAQGELLQILGNQEKMQKFLEDKHVQDLMNQIGDES